MNSRTHVGFYSRSPPPRAAQFSEVNTMLRMIRTLGIVAVAIAGGAGFGEAMAVPTFLQQANYRSFADSPFLGNTLGTFYLEDFEDGALNTPGVAAINNTAGLVMSVITPAVNTDSVDGDDGAIDGLGRGGHSFASFPNGASENLGYTFVFDAGVLGSLPTHVGIVWTDGGFGASSQVEFFDGGGGFLGMIGPVAVGNNSFTGETAEDYFFGVIEAGGIGSFTIRDPGHSNNLEVDHLQYGLQAGPPTQSPVPSALWWLGPMAVAGVLVTNRQTAFGDSRPFE